MAKRKTISAAMERRIIMAQMTEECGETGVYLTFWRRKRISAVLLCGCGCEAELKPHTPVIHEHMVPLAMGGADDETNIRLVRKECAKKKTHGTPATTAGSDIANIAKVKRLRGETGQRKYKHTWPSRKIPPRPFEKRREA